MTDSIRNPIDYECGHCGAKKQHPCRASTGKLIVGYVHMPRLKAAGAYGGALPMTQALDAYMDAVLLRIFGRVTPDLRKRAKQARSIDFEASWVRNELAVGRSPDA